MIYFLVIVATQIVGEDVANFTQFFEGDGTLVHLVRHIPFRRLHGPKVTSTCPAAVNDNYFYIVVMTATGQVRAVRRVVGMKR